METNPMQTLPYQNALITGASSGLGRGLTLWFAQRGVRVYAAARRLERLQALCAEPAAGPNIQCVQLDVSDASEVRRKVQEIDAASGGLDLIIANAGVGLETRGKRLVWDNVEQTIRVNVMGAAATLCAVLDRMVERNRGHLVGISSLAGWRGFRRLAAYSASKAFLATFLEGLRVDLRQTKIKVTCIYPGFVKSEMTAKNTFKMPFLLEADDAADRMARAIVAARSEFAFPWQLSGMMRAVRLLPNVVFDAASRKLT
jgi:short-subunit dehydrogenase